MHNDQPANDVADFEDTQEIPVEEMRRRIAKSFPDLEPYESGEFPAVILDDVPA